MNDWHKEAILYAAGGLLLAAVILLAVSRTPSVLPVDMAYPSATTNAGTASVAPSSATAPTAVAGRIDLNTADKAALMTLDGIGETLAARIIAYREARGGFQSVEELLQVEGIGEKRFAAIREHITVE